MIVQQKGRIEALDSALKKKLLERVEELEKYASDFFGRLREVFANNPDIKVVGDRFVFQSEVLFASGEATLSAAGGGDLDKFAAVYRQLASRLPADLPVIIEVQGHTDRVPVRGRFPSNWELSTARAQQVVNYLIQQGIPPERLAAVGMAEYHPIDPADNAEAYRRNRRIELKITSR
ncbi:MAG: OmpA family protein [Synechococcaceae cyanobacterium SM1_2_3]|nr:OmpA family protein [Synechococcaceae cyanobacterium SM1_2_3]